MAGIGQWKGTGLVQARQDGEKPRIIGEAKGSEGDNTSVHETRHDRMRELSAGMVDISSGATQAGKKFPRVPRWMTGSSAAI